jgi:hypothetical protein
MNILTRNDMKKDAQKLAEQIIKLVSELAELAGTHRNKKPISLHNSSANDKMNKSGATGGIRLLVKEGKLDSPRQLPEIMEFLRQEGRHYPRPTVSMGLLNLVRDRVLTRFREKGSRNWRYVIRK